MDDPFSPRLLAWFAGNRRDLPWRHSSDPYAIWVSEVMLQQTRVETVIPYYLRWMERFPTIPTLAAAAQNQVLALWEGLGYYSRARNLHKAAQIIVEQYGGCLPGDLPSLKILPGIGGYTAAAIASIAFGQDFPAVDGNVRRVYSRMFDIREPLETKDAERHIQELAQAHLPRGKAGDYNQAVMELGALICRPSSPDCAQCPVKDSCRAQALGVQEARPVRKSRPRLPHHVAAAAVIRSGDQVLITQRPQDGLLGGMWAFPTGMSRPGENLEQVLERELQESLGLLIHIDKPLGVFQHAYTHFRVTLHAYFCSLAGEAPFRPENSSWQWVRLPDLEPYPMGKLDRQISRQLVKAEFSGPQGD